jgi:DNA-binding PadR family transcriptional regulator
MALSHAILTALTSTPCSGYDLAKKFDGSVGFFWNASHQQIYRELAKLEENQYIEATAIRQENRPDKKIYQLTTLGENYLREWIAKPSTVAPIKDELLVKIFAGNLVDTATILSELNNHRVQHQNSLNTYHAIEQQFFAQSRDADSLSSIQRYQYITLRQGIQLETAWLAWCDEAITLLKSEG